VENDLQLVRHRLSLRHPVPRNLTLSIRWTLKFQRKHWYQRTVFFLHCNTRQHTTTPCNTLQHNATHCNTNFNGNIGISALSALRLFSRILGQGSVAEESEYSDRNTQTPLPRNTQTQSKYSDSSASDSSASDSSAILRLLSVFRFGMAVPTDNATPQQRYTCCRAKYSDSSSRALLRKMITKYFCCRGV